MDFGSNPHVDDAAWEQAKLIRQGFYMADDGNEFCEVVHASILPTHSKRSYEKSLRLTEVSQHDPSDYTFGEEICRDACGDDSRCTVKAGNMTGRGWGGYSDVVIEAGADGLAIGRETCVENHGADQTLLDQYNSKYAHLIVARGTKPLTAAIYAVNGDRDAGFHIGFGARANSFPSTDDSFLVLYAAHSNTPIFRVNAAGELTHAFGC